MTEASRFTSTVKWFDSPKGYGFIVDPYGGKDIFVHFSRVFGEGHTRELDTGDVVEFCMVDRPKGPAAERVVLVRRGRPTVQTGRSSAVSLALAEPHARRSIRLT